MIAKYKKIMLSSLILITGSAFAEQDLIGVQPYSINEHPWLHEKIQPEHAKILLTIKHNGGFVAHYQLQYLTELSEGVWGHKFFKTGDLTLWKTRQFLIPSDASEIVVTSIYHTGLFWAPERTLFMERLKPVGTPNETIHVDATIWGTIFNPRYTFTYDR